MALPEVSMVGATQDIRQVACPSYYTTIRALARSLCSASELVII